jgi:cellulose synthase/poly-beta-1,6-N-acetylglucosamine synthase-like glycosyltransferase
MDTVYPTKTLFPTSQFPPGTKATDLRLCALLPGKNESLVIARTIKSIGDAHVSAKDIYVVDDGSSDNTGEIARALGVNVLTNSVNVGKAESITLANLEFHLDDRYDVICLMDADSIVDEDYYDKVAEAFLTKPDVAVVSANTKSIKYNWLTAYRAMVYAMSNWVYKQGQSSMGVITVVPGFAANYSARAFKHLTWDSDTVTEDMDTTIQVHKKKLGSIVYCEHADTYTQDPGTLKDYIKQIYRWYTGAWQVGKKHKCFFGTDKIDIEYTFIMLESLIFSVFYMLIPVWMWFWPKRVIIAVLLEYFAMIMWTSVTAVATKRWDILRYSPMFIIVRAVDCFVMCKSFINTMVLQKQERAWNAVARYVESK